MMLNTSVWVAVSYQARAGPDPEAIPILNYPKIFLFTLLLWLIWKYAKAPTRPTLTALALLRRRKSRDMAALRRALTSLREVIEVVIPGWRRRNEKAHRKTSVTIAG